jgi:hypothetical protein
MPAAVRAMMSRLGCATARMLHALWMWAITLCHSPWLPDVQPTETSTGLIVRIATAIVDLDSIAVSRSRGAVGQLA